MYTEEYIKYKREEWAQEQLRMKETRYDYYEYPGPTQEELDKYPQVKEAWERYLVVYELTA